MKRYSLAQWIKYGAALGAGALISIAAAFARGFAAGQPGYLAARYFSDGFFVAGLILSGLGGLIWISSTGFFDMLSYGFHSLLVLFSGLKKPETHESFYDYKTRRDERRGKPQFFILIVGLGFLALSLTCLALYSYLAPAG